VSPSRASRPKARTSKPVHAKPVRKAARPAPKKAAPPRSGKPGKPAAAAVPQGAPPTLPVPTARRSDGRRHLLSLSFVRDGDEFLARMETDSGHITELKNRALDQLLTLVAGELEDLLE